MLISLEQNSEDIVNAVAARALSCTVQLMVRSEGRPAVPKPLASGLFMHINGRYVLLTAGHCIQDVKGNLNKIGIMVDRHFYAISGHTWVHADSKIDIGFVLLSEASEKVCRTNFFFLSENLLMPTYRVTEADNYIIAGYPATRTDVNAVSKKITTEAFVLHTVPKGRTAYTNSGLDQAKAILAAFSRTKSRFYGDSHFHRSPEPDGMSGSGLWYIPSFVAEKPGLASFYLIGIMTEYHPRRSLFVATHILEALKIIRQTMSYSSEM